MYWRRMYAKGKPHPPYNKVFQGCGLTLGIIIILIGPILLFSDITPLSDRMPVVDAQLKLAIKTSGGGLSDGGAWQASFELGTISRFELTGLRNEDQLDNALPYSPLVGNLGSGRNDFDSHLCNDDGFPNCREPNICVQTLRTEGEISALDHCGYSNLLRDYKADYQLLKFANETDGPWQITPSARQALLEIVGQNTTTKAQLEITLTVVRRVDGREAGAGLAETRESHTAIVGPLNTAAKAALAAAVSVPPAAAMTYEPGTADENDGALMFPKFIKFDASSQVEVPPSPLVGRTEDFWHTKQPLTLSTEGGIGGGGWWGLSQAVRDASNFNTTESDGVQILVVASEVAGGQAYSAITGGTLIGFYIAVVWTLSSLVRGIFGLTRYHLIQDEMPETRDLVDLCQGVHIARSEHDLERETKLFETLLRIMRSPAVLLKLTGKSLRRWNEDEHLLELVIAEVSRRSKELARRRAKQLRAAWLAEFERRNGREPTREEEEEWRRELRGEIVAPIRGRRTGTHDDDGAEALLVLRYLKFSSSSGDAKESRVWVLRDSPVISRDACSDQRLGAMLLEVVQRRQQIEDTKAAVNDPLEALLVTPPAWDLEQ